MVSCRWQKCHYKKKTGFSEWAMGAQAEALVPSTMRYTVCYNFICASHSQFIWNLDGYSIHSCREVCKLYVRRAS